MKILHVTEILGKYIDWSRIPDLRLYEACQRGQIVHAACGVSALGGYVAPLPEAYAGYYKSFRRWFDHNVARVIMAEQTLVDSNLGFTGRPDLVVELINGLILLVDLKTPIAESKTWRIQLAAYWYLLDRAGTEVKIQASASLRLRANGAEAVAVRYDDWLADFDIFLSALNAHRALIG
jgi:predicted RecB family nuclease